MPEPAPVTIAIFPSNRMVVPFTVFDATGRLSVNTGQSRYERRAAPSGGGGDGNGEADVLIFWSLLVTQMAARPLAGRWIDLRWQRCGGPSLIAPRP